MRLIRVHDLNGPNAAYVQDMTTTFRDPEIEAQNRAALAAEVQRRCEVALGAGHPDYVYRAFNLLGGLSSHDITILRGAFGSPAPSRTPRSGRTGSYILSTLDYGADCRCVFEIGIHPEEGI